MTKLKSYLKHCANNNVNVDLPKFFQENGVRDIDHGEKLFKTAVEEIIKEKRASKGKSWAKATKGHGYCMLYTEKMRQFWMDYAFQHASSSRLIRFYDDESRQLQQTRKRQKIRKRSSQERIHEREQEREDALEADESDSGLHDNDTSESEGTTLSQLEVGNAQRDEGQTSPDLVQTWTDFITQTNFSNSHYYRLESYGIIQCGRMFKKLDDVPAELYDRIKLEDQIDSFPFKNFGNYFKTVVLSDAYGTIDCPNLIFKESVFPLEVDKLALHFLTRILYIFSEQIHNKLNQRSLTVSEVMYCHLALWPLTESAAHAVPTLVCNFQVGEVPLKAMNCYEGVPEYNADGIVYLQDSKVEVLLLEASGALGTRDRSRHVFDHLKGAFGCYAMLLTILEKYSHADPSLLEDVFVLFLHSSGKDDFLRLWIMRPRANGTIVSFERLSKCRISSNSQDVKSLCDAIDFFWLVQTMLTRCVDAVQRLKRSNDENILDFGDNHDKIPLPKLLRPTPIKPDKHVFYKGIADLDPVSILL